MLTPATVRLHRVVIIKRKAYCRQKLILLNLDYEQKLKPDGHRTGYKSALSAI